MMNWILKIETQEETVYLKSSVKPLFGKHPETGALLTVKGEWSGNIDFANYLLNHYLFDAKISYWKERN